jgi:cation diffusion facilitator CzcD-associated flavoprotein CzcO
VPEKFIKFEHRLTSAIWDEEAGKWHLKVEHNGQTIEDTCDLLVNASGPLK